VLKALTYQQSKRHCWSTCVIFSFGSKINYSIPVLVKLTPNISDITDPGVAAVRGGADGVTLINTLKSIVQVDLDDFIPLPKGKNASSVTSA